MSRSAPGRAMWSRKSGNCARPEFARSHLRTIHNDSAFWDNDYPLANVEAPRRMIIALNTAAVQKFNVLSDPHVLIDDRLTDRGIRPYTDVRHSAFNIGFYLLDRLVEIRPHYDRALYSNASINTTAQADDRALRMNAV